VKSEIKQVITNSAWNSGSFAAISLLMLLTTPFFVKKLGVEGYGIYILITSLIGYYGLLDLGLGEALIKFISEFNSKEDNQSICRAINSALMVQLLIGCLASASLILFSQFIIPFLKISDSYRDAARFGISVCSLGFLFIMISSAFSSAIKGIQRFDITSKVDSLINIAITVTLVILLLSGYGLKECLVVNVVTNFIMLVTYIIIIKKLIPTWKPVFVADRKYIRSFFQFSFYLFLSKLSGIFANYIVRFIISFFLSPVAVTYYVVPSKLVGAVGGFMGGAVNSVFPYSSALHSANDQEGIKKTFLTGSKILTGIAAPISFVLILLSKPILTLWMGPEFAEKSWIILCILSLGALIGSLSAIPNTIIMGLGNSKLVGIFALITLVLYTVLVPPFTKMFGILGTSIALLLNSSLVIFFVIHRTTKYLGVHKGKYLKEVVAPHIYHFIALSILFYICYFLLKFNIFLIFMVGSAYLSITIIYLINKDIIPFKIILKTIFKTKHPDF